MVVFSLGSILESFWRPFWNTLGSILGPIFDNFGVMHMVLMTMMMKIIMSDVTNPCPYTLSRTLKHYTRKRNVFDISLVSSQGLLDRRALRRLLAGRSQHRCRLWLLLGSSGPLSAPTSDHGLLPFFVCASPGLLPFFVCASPLPCNALSRPRPDNTLCCASWH